MILLQPVNIENAVIELCNSLDSTSLFGMYKEVSEVDLWNSMITCVLSSQVGYETAVVFSQRLADEKLLPPVFEYEYNERHEHYLFEVLSTPMCVLDKMKRYRFPKAKARQIAKTAKHFDKNQLRLTEIFATGKDPKSIRDNLVKNVTGLGPKQASMFMRDTNKSDELAIIDRHILDYMVLVNLISPEEKDTFSSSKYLSYEVELESYANFMGQPIGLLDWAIWIIMRTLKKGKFH